MIAAVCSCDPAVNDLIVYNSWCLWPASMLCVPSSPLHMKGVAPYTWHYSTRSCGVRQMQIAIQEGRREYRYGFASTYCIFLGWLLTSQGCRRMCVKNAYWACLEMCILGPSRGWCGARPIYNCASDVGVVECHLRHTCGVSGGCIGAWLRGLTSSPANMTRTAGLNWRMVAIFNVVSKYHGA